MKQNWLKKKQTPLIADQAGAQQAEISDRGGAVRAIGRAGRTDMPSATAVQDRAVSRRAAGEGSCSRLRSLTSSRYASPAGPVRPDEGDIASAGGEPASEPIEELVPLSEVQPLPPLPVEEGLEMLPPAEEAVRTENLEQRGGVDHGE